MFKKSPLTGWLLCAANHQVEPGGMVVLVCLNEFDGGFGLRLDQPASQCLGDVFARRLPSPLASLPLYRGGARGGEHFSFLYAGRSLYEIIPGMGFAQSQFGEESFVDALCDLAAPEPDLPAVLRVFRGHVAWATSRSLALSIEQGLWFAWPATVELIFSARPEELWLRLIEARKRCRSEIGPLRVCS